MQEKRNPTVWTTKRDVPSHHLTSIHTGYIYHSLRISDNSDPNTFPLLLPHSRLPFFCVFAQITLLYPSLKLTLKLKELPLTTKAKLWSMSHILWPFTLRSAWRWSYKKKTGYHWETGFKIIKVHHLWSLSLPFVSASFSSMLSKQTMASVIFMT